MLSALSLGLRANMLSASITSPISLFHWAI